MLVERIISRPEQVFQNIDQSSQTGLEIGALDNPIALKEVGRVYYADYCSTEQLRENHRNTPSVNTDNIVQVDFVTNGGAISDVVPEGVKFDYVIVSHVIEHVPDIISWLQDVGKVLKPNGILSLIVPNKENTFDMRRSLSEQKDFFSAYIQKQTKPSPIQVFDSYRWHDRDGRIVHTLEYTIQKATEALASYVDCHCWVFTPESFNLEIQNLISEGLIPFRLEVVTKTPENEIDMFARLVKV